MKTKKQLPPLKAIRAKCLECCYDQKNEVKLCPCGDCPIYPYRFGVDPFRKKREYTEEQRAAIGTRLKESRQAAQ